MVYDGDLYYWQSWGSWLGVFMSVFFYCLGNFSLFFITVVRYYIFFIFYYPIILCPLFVYPIFCLFYICFICHSTLFANYFQFCKLHKTLYHTTILFFTVIWVISRLLFQMMRIQTMSWNYGQLDSIWKMNELPYCWNATSFSYWLL